MRACRRPMEQLDRWVDEKTRHTERCSLMTQLRRGKGYDMSQLPQITEEIITVRINCKRRDERLIAI